MYAKPQWQLRDPSDGGTEFVAFVSAGGFFFSFYFLAEKL